MQIESCHGQQNNQSGRGAAIFGGSDFRPNFALIRVIKHTLFDKKIQQIKLFSCAFQNLHNVWAKRNILNCGILESHVIDSTCVKIFKSHSRGFQRNLSARTNIHGVINLRIQILFSCFFTKNNIFANGFNTYFK